MIEKLAFVEGHIDHQWRFATPCAVGRSNSNDAYCGGRQIKPIIKARISAKLRDWLMLIASFRQHLIRTSRVGNPDRKRGGDSYRRFFGNIGVMGLVKKALVKKLNRVGFRNGVII